MSITGLFDNVDRYTLRGIENIILHYLDIDFNEKLIYYTRYGFLDIVKALVYAKADVHAFNNLAIRKASEIGYIDIVKFLVDHKADITADNNYAIRYADMNKHTDVADFLMANILYL